MPLNFLFDRDTVNYKESVEKNYKLEQENIVSQRLMNLVGSAWKTSKDAAMNMVKNIFKNVEGMQLMPQMQTLIEGFSNFCSKKTGDSFNAILKKIPESIDDETIDTYFDRIGQYIGKKVQFSDTTISYAKTLVKIVKTYPTLTIAISSLFGISGATLAVITGGVIEGQIIKSQLHHDESELGSNLTIKKHIHYY
jgi:hypothetical protein